MYTGTESSLAVHQICLSVACRASVCIISCLRLRMTDLVLRLEFVRLSLI